MVAAQFHPIFWLTEMIFDLAGKRFCPMYHLSERRAVGVAGKDTTILASCCSAPKMVMSPASPSSIGNLTPSNPHGVMVRYVWLLRMLMCCVHILAKCEE
jgi:hypothetical protein